jgi:hypothetical protein
MIPGLRLSRAEADLSLIFALFNKLLLHPATYDCKRLLPLQADPWLKIAA